MTAITFEFVARDALGGTQDGTVSASSREEAIQKLRRDGLQIVELEEESLGGSLIPARVSKSDIVYITGQLAVMVDTGITLSVALESIARQEQNATLKTVLLDLKSQVESGEDFSTALSRHPKHFDRTYLALIKASEKTGTLAEMLENISLYMRNQLDTAQKVRGALAYPTVMLVLATGVTIFLLTYVLPKFEPLFTRKGIKLPMMTTVLMTTSDAMLDYWWAWLIGVVVLAVTFIVGRKTPTGRGIMDWLAIHTPIIGPLVRKVILSRSVRTLGTMVESGVSMLEALRLAGEVSSNVYYERAWHHALDQVTEGKSICDSLYGHPLFPGPLVQMIAAGEDTGKLDHVLRKVSLHYDKEVEAAIKSATTMLEPLMITVMGVVVGGIAMGLLLPIFSLSRAPAG
ncbi:type II secretion system F family protein [Anatilimnocola sp. NA78]|uniref:type II secretion system F family protein n=1 Tax=Anatilimnocola sp. NA78 TaxID=3415683 RepID=UPI003CE53BFE